MSASVQNKENGDGDAVVDDLGGEEDGVWGRVRAGWGHLRGPLLSSFSLFIILIRPRC